MTLQEIQKSGEYRVAELVAESLGLPLVEVVVPLESSDAVYEREMGKAFFKIRDKGICRIAFGDIFLEDLRDYRERQLAASGLTCLFPLWKRPTRSLAQTFIDDGFRAVTVCVYSKVFDESFAGRHFDVTFLDDLPSGVNPCGENGELHTFVFDGPIFFRSIKFAHGEIVEKDGFFFHDLLPKANPRTI